MGFMDYRDKIIEMVRQVRREEFLGMIYYFVKVIYDKEQNDFRRKK